MHKLNIEILEMLYSAAHFMMSSLVCCGEITNFMTKTVARMYARSSGLTIQVHAISKS